MNEDLSSKGFIGFLCVSFVTKATGFPDFGFQFPSDKSLILVARHMSSDLPVGISVTRPPLHLGSSLAANFGSVCSSFPFTL